MDNIYYVYILYREDGITPFYVGKGKGKRLLDHERSAKLGRSHKDNIICKMLSNGLSIPKSKIAEGLTHKEAIKLEIELIALYKRICDGGVLTNCTTGGEGLGGVKHSEETRIKLRIARNKRHPISEETRIKLSVSHMGHSQSEETRAKIAAARRGSLRGPHSAEVKDRISASKRGCVSPNKGRSTSIETKAKISASLIGNNLSIETKTKISNSLRGHVVSKETREKISKALKGRKK